MQARRTPLRTSVPPLRVAFDNSLAGQNRTGTGVYAAQLIRQLRTKPEVILQVLEGPRWGHGGRRRLTRTLVAAGRVLWAQSYLPFYLHKQRFDLLHSPSFVLPAKCACPAVVTIHDLLYLLYPEHFERSWRNYVTALMPRVLNSASAVICVSESSKSDLLNHYKIPAGKVYVVYNGLDHAKFYPGQELDVEWARSIGLRTEYVLHVGTLAQKKNIPLLLHAVSLLRSAGKFASVQLVLAGPESPGVFGAIQIRDAIKNLDLGDVVVVAGHVPEEKLPGLYAAARLVVMPSMYEGFGLPVIESMACGTPVVASNSSSLPEVAGDAAILVPPHSVEALSDAIAEVMSKDTLAAEMRIKGLQQANRFSWERTAAETVKVYRSVVNC